MFETRFLGALLLGLSASLVASGQAAAASNVPRPDYIATMDWEFGKMDGDKNGQVSRAAVESFERGALFGQARARAQAAFAVLGTDRNGQVSLIQHRAGELSRFNPIDSDKDGVVSVAGMKAAGVIK